METGVPYVERYATEALDLGGVRIERGQRIRLMLQSIAYSDEASGRARMFGMGAHACLGRQISLDLWGCLARKLGETAMTAEIVEHTMRRSDFVFTCPERLVVRFRSPVSSAGVAAN
jgi:cytochrome P450